MKLKIKINNASEAHDFINKTSSFSAGIDLSKGSYVIDAKSLIALFTMDFSEPFVVDFYSDDADEIAKFKEAMGSYILPID